MKDLCKRFLENLPEFEWFIAKYYGYEAVEELKALAKKDSNAPRLFTMLNQIWFQLPDNKFNIIQNPKGWKEFLSLIEV